MTGDSLPAISDLAEHYNVAIVTVRTALRNLHKDGYIRMAQGKNAIVIFNNIELEGNETYWKCIAERKKSLTEICEACSLILPDMMVEASRLLDENDIAALEQIVEETHPRMKIYQIVDQLDMFQNTVTRKLDNALFLNLMEEINEFIGVIPILLKGPDAYSPMYTENVKIYMGKIVEYIKNGNETELKKWISSAYLKAIDQLNDAFSQMAPNVTADKEKSFTWMLPDCSQLSIALTYTIMYKVTLGVYKNGDFLPSESAYQEHYSVSKKPIRAAMLNLNELGMAVTIRGKGTQISTASLNKIDFEKIESLVKNRAHLEAMHILKLTFATVANQLVPKLPLESIEKVEGQLYDLKYDRTGKYYLCSPTALVLDMVISGSENKALNLIYHRLMSRIIIANYLRIAFKDNYPDTYTKALENNFKALEEAKKRDVEGFNQLLNAILDTAFSITFEQITQRPAAET